MRALVAIALLGLSAITAAAEGVASTASPAVERQEGCQVVPGTYPRNGSTDVPVNVHAWVFGGMQGEYVLRHGHGSRTVIGKLHGAFRVVEVDLGRLGPATEYTLEYAGRTLTTFTTGWTADNKPPDAPTLDDVIARSHPGAWIELGVHATGEQVLDELTVSTDGERQTVIAPPTALRTFGAQCIPAVLQPGKDLCVDLVELDLAGNRSDVVVGCTTIDENRHAYLSESSDEYVFDERWEAPIVMAIITMFLSLIVLGVRSSMAHSVYQHKALSPIAAELARKAALAHRYDAKAMAAACSVGCLLAALTGPRGCSMLGWLPVALVTMSLVKWLGVAGFLRSLDAGKVTPRYAGRYVFVDHRWIVLKPTELQQLVNEALPSAKLR